MAKIKNHKSQITNYKLFTEAKKFIPGGVNSPVRSFRAVGGSPVFIKKGKGSRIYSEDGKSLVDYCLSWGALILGHAHPKAVKSLDQAISRGTSYGTVTKLETELADLIVDAVPSIEQVRLTNSGTEAVMSAVRVARAYTKRDAILKFEGYYHGHADYLLAKAGSGVATLGIPDSPGVPADFTRHTVSAAYNDVKTAADLIRT
ncbi:MAG: aminotransferase class III-fold pyridoxal phosphate-dependent enzyme, partial [Candidatus Omnitrophota bacterium]